MLGTDLTWAHEEHDAVGAASAISLSAGQLALLRAVTDSAAKPIVVITLTATPLDLTPVFANPKVGSPSGPSYFLLPKRLPTFLLPTP